MKKLFLTTLLFLSISATAQEPIRCKSMTRWGQCTNESVTTDSLCILHKETSQQQRTSTITPLTSTTRTSTTSATTSLTTPTTTTRTTTATRATPTRTVTTSTRAVTRSSSRTSSRCAARTKSGSQCSRKPKPGSAYCWQHSR